MPALAAPPATRRQRAAEFVAELVHRSNTDRWDRTCLAGLLLLTIGLWVWIGLGVALTTAGFLVLALGVAGAIWADESEPDGSVG